MNDEYSDIYIHVTVEAYLIRTHSVNCENVTILSWNTLKLGLCQFSLRKQWIKFQISALGHIKVNGSKEFLCEQSCQIKLEEVNLFEASHYRPASSIDIKHSVCNSVN